VKLSLVFLGSSDFAVPTLQALLEAGHAVPAAYTHPPRPAGRGLAACTTPVHALALARGIAVRVPASLADPKEQQAFAEIEADAAVVAAYGVLLPRAILEAPRLGCFNVHPSLLPRWRGAAPVERAILAGDTTTGVSIMRMDEGLDTGPVCLHREVPLDDGTTAGELRQRLAREGGALMVEALRQAELGSLACKPQAMVGVSYARKLDTTEAHIDFARPAEQVLRQIHACSPRPGAFTNATVPGSMLRLKFLKAEPAAGAGRPGEVIDDDLAIACGRDAVRPLIVQRPGKSALARRDFLRGLAIGPGTLLA
jgi:methionyl-tRNA formyltransferase